MDRIVELDGDEEEKHDKYMDTLKVVSEEDDDSMEDDQEASQLQELKAAQDEEADPEELWQLALARLRKLRQERRQWAWYLEQEAELGSDNEENDHVRKEINDSENDDDELLD